MTENPGINRYDYIDCPLPAQKDAQRIQAINMLEKEDFSILKLVNRRPHVTYFIENNTPKKHMIPCAYDSIYNPEQTYNQYISQCNRTSQKTAWKTLHIEEEERTIPLRVNATYGKRKTNLSGEPIQWHGRTASYKDLLSRNGINIKQDVSVPSFNIIPEL